MDKIEKVIKAFEFCLMPPSREEIENDVCSHEDCPYYREYNGGKCISAAVSDALALLKAHEPTQWHKEGCAKNSSVCIVDIGNDMPALLAAVVVNGRFIFDGLDITEKVRHWFAIPGIKVDGQAVKWE